MKTNDIYEQLNQYKKFNWVVKLSDEVINIVFHEYLSLSLYHYEYRDEWTCVINNNTTHWHTHGDDLINDLIDIAQGNIVFIEQRNWLRRFLANPIQMVKLDVFNIQKDKYLNKKVRIYSGNCIFKYT